jgi:cytochrome oxidase Cu insertion factor (SCO1/SenC/PrrC family)
VTRWLSTAGIGALLLLTLALPYTGMGRRGNEDAARLDSTSGALAIGKQLPELGLEDLEGRPLGLEDLRGHPVLITFERSVDW